jgi:molybdopterin-biosynthesis enzyme MoeA-like protein
MTGQVFEDPPGFGLIVVGDEVLVGGRSDAHLGHFKELLARHGYSLAWYWLLPDDPQTLTDHLRRALACGLPVFCCGGIGATPDDHTRACVAAAADRPLVRHPGAAALIEGRFGAAAYPHRIRMADLPAGCGLIDNPYNQIPGFKLGECYFLPGFPQMAWPMAEAILAARYPGQRQACREVAVRVVGVPESRLIPLLERLTLAHPRLKVFSLPHLPRDPVEPGHILVGMRGRAGLEAGLADLRSGLEAEGIAYLPDPEGSGGPRHAPDVHPRDPGPA